MRFYLVDRVEEIKYGEYIKGVKCVSLSEDLFDEHFPGFPVYPGTLVIESMAQLAGTLFEISMRKRGEKLLNCALSMVNQAKFKKPVKPGDKMILTATVLGYREDSGKCRVLAEVDDEPAALAELTFTFHDLDIPALKNDRELLYETFMKDAKVL